MLLKPNAVQTLYLIIKQFKKMIKFLKSIAFTTLMVSGFALAANAQTVDSNKVAHHKYRKEAHQKLAAVLTPQQQAQLKADRKKHKEALVAFRSTLTADQKAIAKDKALSHKERRAKLAATFTDKQKKALADNKEARKASRKAFFASLNADQKAKMKELFKDRKSHAGARHHKAQKA